jgi:23S rRNA-/tRNA-specific pseudouridylate synthase
MLLLAHPYSCHFARAWQSSSPRLVGTPGSQPRRHHFATRPSLLALHSEQQQSAVTVDVDTNDCSLTPQMIRNAYDSRETDGILDLAKKTSILLNEPLDIIQASVKAADGNKGMEAGMMNAWIGACYDASDGAQLALQLLQAYDNVSEKVQIYPDVVTLSLVYSILCREDGYQQMAESILERAMKLSKKQGGSKRRRELAAARRRGPSVNCRDVEQRLQDLYGPEFRVLQESDDFIVLSKPSGMVCFHKFKTTAGKIKSKRRTKSGRKNNDSNKDVSLVDALLNENVALSTLNADGRGLVHRLDRGTSGCIVLAKTNDAHAKLVTQFFLRNAKKSYTAIVSSSLLEEPDTGEINLPVDGRPAKSVYNLLERFDNGTAKIKMETLTGRKHQVRVHCAKGLQSPIMLDPIYDSTDRVEKDDGRFFLHASSLSIPEFGIDVEAPIPAWWAEVQNKLL